MKRFSGALTACMTMACATSTSASELRSQRGGYEVEVLVDGAAAPTFSHAGETYVMGQIGARYVVRVSNHTGRRVEVVVSVDGRDVVDGKPAGVGKRGYLVPAWGSVDVDGWRLSARQAAAFRFSSVADSYAARTGSAREVGVIGVAVFAERVYAPPPPRYPYDFEERSRREGAPSVAPSASAPGRGAASPPAPAEASPASPAAEAADDKRDSARGPQRRPGLGTEFGEAVSSPVREVAFQRAARPPVVLGLRYNDRDGLVAMGVDVDGDLDDTGLRQTAIPFPVSHRGYAAPPPGWQGR